MTTITPEHPIWGLLDALCENRLSRQDAQELERLVEADPDVRSLYVAYLDLHGTLAWDAGFQGAITSVATTAGKSGSAKTFMATRAGRSTPVASHSRLPQWAVVYPQIAAAVTVAALVVGLLLAWGNDSPTENNSPVGPRVTTVPVGPSVSKPRQAVDSHVEDRSLRVAPRNLVQAMPMQSDPTVGSGHVRSVPEHVDPSTPIESTPIVHPEVAIAATGDSSEGLLSVVDRKLRQRWQETGVSPSPRADDAEWLRRVYLDLVGHIPPVDVLEPFLADEHPDKRSRMIDGLLDDSDYVRHWTNLWTNLLVGQDPPPEVNRPALQRFLREGFARNRPWNEVVFDLLSAEGRADENGAANFLIAHLNEGAIPATAITARLFLGRQLQCTQCHNHPFNDWKQEHFWGLNSFFAQAERKRHEAYDRTTGTMQLQTVELVREPVEGPVYFETRTGLMKVAFPRFQGHTVSADADTDRRAELARLITSDERPLLAEAMVNRMWAHFFGQGFTTQVDDLGPHNPPSHPEVLNRLSSEFVRSGYDLKQLIRWICKTEAYQLTSRFNDTNTADDPLAGNPPLFSHMYVKALSPEQVYDSLVVASRGTHARMANWDATETTRDAWLQQFVISFDTEENCEGSTFDGTIPQSLLMMNGDLIEAAVSTQAGTFLNEVLRSSLSETDKIRQLYFAAFSRPPTAHEIAAVRKVIRQRARQKGARGGNGTAEAFQDVFWACLNSGEFVLNH